MILLYDSFKYLSMGNYRLFMTKTRFGNKDLLNGVRVFGDIWGSIGVDIGRNNTMRNKGRGGER